MQQRRFSFFFFFPCSLTSVDTPLAFLSLHPAMLRYALEAAVLLAANGEALSQPAVDAVSHVRDF